MIYTHSISLMKMLLGRLNFCCWRTCPRRQRKLTVAYPTAILLADVRPSIAMTETLELMKQMT